MEPISLSSAFSTTFSFYMRGGESGAAADGMAFVVQGNDLLSLEHLENFFVYVLLTFHVACHYFQVFRRTNSEVRAPVWVMLDCQIQWHWNSTLIEMQT